MDVVVDGKTIGERKTWGNRPCLWETHPDLARGLLDPSEGLRIGKGTDKKVSWKCKHGHITSYRTPDKIIRGNHCGECDTYTLNDTFTDVVRNIKRVTVAAVRNSGNEYCTTCDSVKAGNEMCKGEKGKTMCRKCNSKVSYKNAKSLPGYIARQNATRAKRARDAAGTFSRQDWIARLDYYGGKCVYCGCDGDMTVEHRIPLSRGGSNWPANLAPACGSCNCKKGTKTETEYKSLLLSQEQN